MSPAERDEFDRMKARLAEAKATIALRERELEAVRRRQTLAKQTLRRIRDLGCSCSGLGPCGPCIARDVVGRTPEEVRGAPWRSRIPEPRSPMLEVPVPRGIRADRLTDALRREGIQAP